MVHYDVIFTENAQMCNITKLLHNKKNCNIIIASEYTYVYYIQIVLYLFRFKNI